MAGLFLVQSSDPIFADSALDTARAQYALHGFGTPVAAELPGWRLLHWPHIIGGPDSLLIAGDNLVAVAGTLTVDGLMGTPALERLLTIDLPSIDWSRIGGHFSALVRNNGRSFVFGDYLAAYQLFHDEDRRLFSTSLLAAANALPRLHFDAQGVYEFAFNVVPIGDDTVFSELKTLGSGHMVELTDGGSVLHVLPRPLPADTTDAPIAERLQRHTDALKTVVDAHVGYFGNRVFCPLSGGLDSRLVLATLRAAGCTPNVYVYGPPGSDDVEIGRAIGKAEGFAVNWIDKSQLHTLAPDAFAEQVKVNFHQFDALPTYGNIFDNGGNALARDARHATGYLAVSGGCGEIYRDFFFLANRPTTAKAVASTFFARFTKGDVTGEFDAPSFLGHISGKIAKAAEVPSDTVSMPRNRVEHIYPRIRCRALFGREISLESRYGAYFMPFLDHKVVAEAMTLPMPLKQAGRFEAMLLNAIDPVLARHPSAYGHDFSGPPSRDHRFSEWSSRIRPAWLRQHSYAIQRRLKPMGDEHGGLLTSDYMDRVIDPAFPAMQRYFRMENITDSGLWRRIACLEYLAQHLGSRLAA